MDSQTFLDNFRIIAEAPGGIDRLRELILDLATRGQLANQVETESAIDLPATSGPYPLPANWIWVKLPDVTRDLGQKSPTNDFHYIDVGSIDSRVGRISDSVSIISADAAPSRARKKVAMGTVIYSTIRPYLRNIAIVDRSFDPEPIASTAFAVLHPGPHLDEKYLFICVRSPFFTRFVESKQKGVAYPAINASDLRMAPIPLPPLAEQQRIASSVQELLKLCDELEAAKEKRDSLRTAARKSAIDAISTATTPDELTQAWKRISSNWISFCDSSSSIESLRMMIIGLATTGKLNFTLQDAPSATPLIDAMRTNQTLALRESNRKTKRPTSSGRKRTQTFPPNWYHGSLGDIALIVMGNSPPGDSYRNAEAGVPLINGPVEFSKDPLGKTVRSKFTVAPTTLCKEGDLLVCVRGATTGRTNIAGFDACIGRGVALVRAWDSQDFVNLVMWHQGSALLAAGKGTTFPSISFEDLANIEIGIPPLEEQNLIVRKVRELLSICDVLEKSLDTRLTIQQSLTTSVLRFASSDSQQTISC